jgi:glyceraldehyde 3-phosphate dehydrogenase
MTVRVGINGFGRIGRQVLKAWVESGYGDMFEIVAVNAVANPDASAHLLKYDSTYGRFGRDVSVVDGNLLVDGKMITALNERDPALIPWGENGVDLVIEATGKFTDAQKSRVHIDGGAKKVLIAAPGKGEDVTLVLGVNEENYDPAKHHIISNASCTTNCLAPVAKVLLDNFGIKRGLMTTVHSYTNDQVILDGSHKDLRRARAAATNIVPTTTGAAKALSLVIPDLKGKVDGFSLRVPTPTVSIVDFVVETDSTVTKEQINQAFIAASESDVMRGILGYTDEPLVSSDLRQDSRSSIVDGLSTMVIGENLAKVASWYDNEWGYSCRIVDMAALIAEAGFPA